jgi:CHAT domain-containing protein
LLRANIYLELGQPNLAWAALRRVRKATGAANPKALEFEIDLLLATDRARQVIEQLTELETARSQAGATSLPPALRLRLGLARVDEACSVPSEPSDAAANSLLDLLEAEVLAPNEQRIAHISLVNLFLHQKRFDEAQLHLRAARDVLAQSQQLLGAGSSPRAQAELEAYASYLLRAQPSDKQTLALQRVELRNAYSRFIEQLALIEPRPGGVGFLNFSTRRFILNELIELSLLVEGPKHGFDFALQALLDAQNLGSLSRGLAQAIATPAEVRKLMTRPDGGVLVFLPDYHRTLVLAFDATRPDLCVVAASKGEWRTQVESWMYELTTSPQTLKSDAARASNLKAIETKGRLVADLLLPLPIRERLAQWKSVTIVGADLMDGLQFEGLPWGEAGTLGTHFALDHAPSMSVNVKLELRRPGRRTQESAAGGLLLVAAPELSGSADPALRRLPKIPFSDQDRDRLQAPYGKASGASFVGAKATRAALEDPRLALASVLQLIAHGSEVADKERAAALVLRGVSDSDDGLLDCDEVEQLAHVPDTVVLSACGAARGQQRYGDDGIQHMGGALLQAGASCVVLSAFTIDANATQALMEVFHQRLCAGDSRAEAMRAARAIVSSIPRYSHPYYHSLILVIGLGQASR